MNKITTIIFDMDGTVLNTLTDLTVSMNHVMSRFGFTTHTEDEYRRAFGNGVKHALRVTVPEGTTDETVDKMFPLFKEHYDAHCLDKTGPYDGILPLMKELKKRGYKMAIVSNKIDSAVKELNRKFFSEEIEVAIGEKDGIRRKPAPDTVFEALKELKSTQEEAVYVGDSEVDFETAKNSGLPCISVLWGFRDEEYLRTVGADIFVKEPAEILDVIETLFENAI
ncbi:MAG: HAD family hydrolase [Butyrivibrio sp.]|nr:HAD family hydrolase [Butyrivibrio sp.]